MKFKILIAVFVFESIFFIVFSSIKASEAEKQKARSEQLFVQLVTLKESAQREAERSERMAAISTEAETRAEKLKKELEKCKSGK